MTLSKNRLVISFLSARFGRARGFFCLNGNQNRAGNNNMKGLQIKLFPALICMILVQCAFGKVPIDSLEQSLQKTMDKQSFYNNAKETAIKNLKSLLKDAALTPENKYFLINKIIDEYEYYSFDAALNFIEQNLAIAQDINNTFYIIESKLRLAKLLAASGLYKESIDVMNEINRKNIPEKLLDRYYFNLNEGYSGLSYYTAVKKSKQT